MGFAIKKILLAEDDRVTAHLIKTQLEQQGFLVTIAGNGREALDIIRSRPIDLLITDVVMPEMDGVDLYLELKKNPATVTLPIIIVTDKQVFQDSFAALGVNHFVSKMSDADVLFNKICEIGVIGSAARNYRKVLISGQEEDVILQMQSLLLARECLVTFVKNPMEIVFKSLVMTPHIILLDVMAQGDIAVSEVIRSLRCYDRLKQSVILTYIDTPSDHFEDTDKLREQLERAITECLAGGATRYIGHFNKGTFVETLQSFGIV
jgi:CheY-like chemotaxis protein